MYFLDKNNVLYKSQYYGFRKNMSTSLAILEMVEEITNAIDDRKSTVGVFIDLKKAFDAVDHNILIKKLEHYGIRGLANKWVRSYLENRNQYVCINDTDSECMKISCGVPQGSILGPALFILGGCPFNGPLSGTKYPTRAASPIQNASTPSRIY